MATEEDYKRINEARNRDRIRSGSAVCPKCGNRWDSFSPIAPSIRAIQIKRFFGKVPGCKCTKCGYEWPMK